MTQGEHWATDFSSLGLKPSWRDSSTLTSSLHLSLLKGNKMKFRTVSWLLLFVLCGSTNASWAPTFPPHTHPKFQIPTDYRDPSSATYSSIAIYSYRQKHRQKQEPAAPARWSQGYLAWAYLLKSRLPKRNTWMFQAERSAQTEAETLRTLVRRQS